MVFRAAHAAGLLRGRLKDRQAHLLTDHVIAPHQFLDLLLRHVQLFAGIEIDGVDDAVGVDMLPVNVGADQHLTAVKVLRQPPRGFVSLPGIDGFALRKTLHHVVEHHAAHGGTGLCALFVVHEMYDGHTAHRQLFPDR